MDKRQKITLITVGIILAVAIVATAIVFFATRGEKFTPPNFAQSAKKGIPTVTETEAQYQRVKAGANFSFSMCLCPQYEQGTARMYFTSDITNRPYLMVKLYDSEGNQIGESGLVKPGEYVESLSISLTPDTDTDVFARILSYEPDTYYSMGTVSGELRLRVDK